MEVMTMISEYIRRWKEQRMTAELRKYPLAVAVAEKHIVLMKHNIVLRI